MVTGVLSFELVIISHEMSGSIPGTEFKNIIINHGYPTGNFGQDKKTVIPAGSWRESILASWMLFVKRLLDIRQATSGMTEGVDAQLEISRHDSIKYHFLNLPY